MNTQTLKQKIQNGTLTKDEIEELKTFVDTAEKVKKEFQIANESKYLSTKEDIANLKTELIEKLVTKKELTTQINNINTNLTNHYATKNDISSSTNKILTILITVIGLGVSILGYLITHQNTPNTPNNKQQQTISRNH